MSASDNLSPKQFNLYFRKSDSSRGLHEVTAYKGDDQVGELKWRADTGEIHNIEVQKQQDLVNQGIKNEYEAKLAAVRNYYSGVHNSSSGKLPSISDAPIRINENAAYAKLTEECTVTTLQLTALQEWVKEQYLVNK